MILPPWDGHASCLEQLEILAGLIRAQRPQTVVESGTYRGHGAIFMGDAIRRNGTGHLWTADPVDYGQHTHIFEQNGLWGAVSVHLERFETMLGNVRGVIDFAYIDGSGENPPKGLGAGLRWLHFEAVRKRLAPGGIICVDDTAADDWTDGEGGRSVQRIRDACQLNFKFLRGLSVYYG